MVQEKRTCVGLDIGTTKTCCIVCQLADKSYDSKLLGAGVVPSSGVRKGIVVNIEEAVRSIEKAVEAAEKMANVKVTRAFVGISGNHIRGINTQGAIATSKNGLHLGYEHEISNPDINRVLEMAKAISLPVDREILHILPQEYVVDDQDGIKDPLGMVGRRLEARVHLITGAVSAAKNITKCAEEAGIAVEGLIYHPMAAAQATLEPHEKELGVALIDIGGGTTDVSVFLDGAVRHSAVIGLGGNNVTNDIAMMLKISTGDAEDIKIKYGSAKASMASTDLDFELPHTPTEAVRNVSEHEVSRYVEARMTEIFQLVKREISRADVSSPVTFGVVLTGGGALLKNITSLAEEAFGGSVKIGIPKGLSGVVDVASSPVYSAAIGLIQYGTTLAGEFNLGVDHEPMLNQVAKRVKRWFSEMF
ncbi:MAG: cell division protein FtsA [Candidatus Neomarinimicrobiota bacterium]